MKLRVCKFKDCKRKFDDPSKFPKGFTIIELIEMIEKREKTHPASSREEEKRPVATQSRCYKHGDLAAVNFCSKDKVYTCQDCYMNYHNGHKFQSIKAFEEKRSYEVDFLQIKVRNQIETLKLIGLAQKTTN